MTHSEESGGKLHVEKSPRPSARVRLAEMEFFLAGVDDQLAIGPEDRIPELGKFAGGKGIDGDDPPVGRHLNQAEDGGEGVLGNEFGVEGDARGGP